MNNHKKALAFMTMAYDDYITARFLINNNFILQGAVLSSTSFEKYFKALLQALFPSQPPRVHLDRLSELKAKLINTEFEDIFNLLDKTFVEELSTIYKFRYYDNFNEPTSIGFLVNQFLGELDNSILNVFNQLMKPMNPDGSMMKTRLYREIESFDKNLYYNNYVLHNINKDEYMNRETHSFSFYINPKKLDPIIMSSNIKVKPGTDNINIGDGLKVDLPKYNGNIFIIRMNENNP